MTNYCICVKRLEKSEPRTLKEVEMKRICRITINKCSYEVADIEKLRKELAKKFHTKPERVLFNTVEK